MRYGLGIKILISFLAGGVAVLYKYRLSPEINQTESEISSVLNIPRQFLFDTLTTPANVPAYFSWVTRLHAEDKRNITVGKRYRGIVNMPFLGQHDIRYKVHEMEKGRWVIFTPEDAATSYFNTEILFMLNSITDTQTQFQLKIAYQRTSALFQLTLGPFLKWLTDQQLRRTVHGVRSLATAKWNKFRFPNGKNATAKPKAPQLKLSPAKMKTTSKKTEL